MKEAERRRGRLGRGREVVLFVELGRIRWWVGMGRVDQQPGQASLGGWKPSTE